MQESRQEDANESRAIQEKLQSILPIRLATIMGATSPSIVRGLQLAKAEATQRIHSTIELYSHACIVKAWKLPSTPVAIQILEIYCEEPLSGQRVQRGCMRASSAEKLTERSNLTTIISMTMIVEK